MGNLSDTKPKSKEETLAGALEELQDVKFHFACFIDQFERYLKKAGMLE